MLFRGWPGKQHGGWHSARAPSPHWVRARTRLQLLVLPTASPVLFLSNCTCSDSGISTGSAPRLAAAAPGVWRLLLQPLRKRDWETLAQETDAAMVPARSRPPHSLQVLCHALSNPAPALSCSSQQDRSSPATACCYTSWIWQKRTVTHHPVCLLKIFPPFNLASGILVKLQGTDSAMQGNDHLPRLWPRWIFRGRQLSSHHRRTYWWTDSSWEAAEDFRLSLSWFQHHLQQHAKILFPSARGCTAKLLFSSCQAFKAGWQHFKNRKPTPKQPIDIFAILLWTQDTIANTLDNWTDSTIQITVVLSLPITLLWIQKTPRNTRDECKSPSGIRWVTYWPH